MKKSIFLFLFIFLAAIFFASCKKEAEVKPRQEANKPHRGIQNDTTNARPGGSAGLGGG